MFLRALRRSPIVAVADQIGLSNAGDMWRGPVWININHQIVRGLHGALVSFAAAATLRDQTLAMLPSLVSCIWQYF